MRSKTIDVLKALANQLLPIGFVLEDLMNAFSDAFYAFWVHQAGGAASHFWHRAAVAGDDGATHSLSLDNGESKALKK